MPNAALSPSLSHGGDFDDRAGCLFSRSDDRVDAVIARHGLADSKCGSRADLGRALIIFAERNVRFTAKRDMCRALTHVSFGPQADITRTSATGIHWAAYASESSFRVRFDGCAYLAC
jgi:hypothetical protein